MGKLFKKKQYKSLFILIVFLKVYTPEADDHKMTWLCIKRTDSGPRPAGPPTICQDST